MGCPVHPTVKLLCGDRHIDATGVAPPDDLEAAVVGTLPAGAYTAVLRNVDQTSGVGLVELYNLP